MNPKGNKMMAKKMPRKVKESSRTPTLQRERVALGLGRQPDVPAGPWPRRKQEQTDNDLWRLKVTVGKGGP